MESSAIIAMCLLVILLWAVIVCCYFCGEVSWANETMKLSDAPESTGPLSRSHSGLHGKRFAEVRKHFSCAWSSVIKHRAGPEQEISQHSSSAARPLEVIMENVAAEGVAELV